MRSILFALILFALVLAGVCPDDSASGQEAGPQLGQIAGSLARQQAGRALRSMNRPVEPFRIIGDIYYVGASGVSSFLITTPQGHILIDGGFEETVPLIRDGVRKLGFRFEDIELLLNSHAHLDHAGGLARLKESTGAAIVMSEADAALLSRGGRGDFLPLGDALATYPPARADRLIGDGDRVSHGGVTLTAHLTPGHTKGCTTWTMTVTEGGDRHEVVFVGGAGVLPGVRLVDNPKYPGMDDDFARTFHRLKSLPCDVFLAPHGFHFDLEEKARRLATGEEPNPFIDPVGYRSFIDRSERVYLDQLRRETRDSAPPAEPNRPDGGR